MDQQEPQQSAPAPKSSTGPIIAVVGLIVIVVVAVLAFQSMNKPSTQNTTTTTEQTQQQPAQTNEQMVAEPTPATSGQASAYKDGTYTAVGNYTSPGGAEQLGVTLTIANGVVTSSEVEVKATRPMSVTRQTDFKEHYKAQVDGKNIDEITLTKVSGSSLSPKGFNDAVEQIKQEAQQS